jgi:hypothetical protein
MSESAEKTTPVENTPMSLDQVLADLRGFGIEEFEEILTLTIAGKKLQMKLSNVPTDGDLTAMLAVEGLKNYAFFQEIKVELLSRAITWLNGIDIAKLTKLERRVIDPSDGLPKDIQVVLRNLIKSWGLEVMQVLWKVLMVHSQTIENRLFENFPQAAQLTDVERRYRERIEKELEELQRNALTERVDEILNEEEIEEPTS